MGQSPIKSCEAQKSQEIQRSDFFRTVITVPKQHLYYYIDYFRDRRFSAIHFRFLLVTKGLHFPKMALGLHFWEEGRK